MTILRYLVISPSNAWSLLDIPFIKLGTKIGGIGGSPFNDSSMISFTSSHYLRGMITERNMLPLEWCQFVYSPSSDSENTLESKLRGTRRTTDINERFILTRHERINKVQVVLDKEIIHVGNIPRLIPLIRGIRLFTTKGQSSRSIDHIEGEIFTEQFDGYTVGYVSGRSGLFIDQLQFHWYYSVGN
jgi:hypothetical protein